MEYEYKTLEFKLTNLDPTGRTVEGYAAAFGNLDLGSDIIHPGAFSKTLAERGNQVKFLWQHERGEPIGKPIEMREDPRGLYIKAVVSDTARGRDALALLRDGAINGLSIGYDAIPGGTDFTRDGDKTIRNLREIKLYEFSLVTYPMNLDASVTDLKAEWDTAYQNDLPDSAFLYIEADQERDEDGKTTPRSARHFPYRNAGGALDLPHLRNAIARIPQSTAPGLDDAAKERLQDRARRLLDEAQKDAPAPAETKVGRAISKANGRRIMEAARGLLALLSEAGFADESPEPADDEPANEPDNEAMSDQRRKEAGPESPPTSEATREPRVALAPELEAQRQLLLQQIKALATVVWG